MSGSRCFALVVLIFSVVLYAGYQSYVLASTVRIAGYDYNEGRNSVRNLLVFKQSLHDVKRVLPSPEFRPSDPGIIEALRRFYSENVVWLTQVVSLHPKQNHPVFLAIVFGVQALFEESPGFFYYNIVQVWFLFGVIATMAAVCCSTTGKRSRLLATALGVTFFICYEHQGSALHVNLMWGQTNLTVMFLSSLSVFLYTKGYARWSGVFLVLAAADKMLPLLLLLAFSPKHYGQVLRGMVFGIAGATFLLFCHAGIVVLLDVLRYPFILWNGPYNMLTSQPIGWLGASTHHSLTNGLRLLSLQLQSSGMCGLLAFVVIPAITIFCLVRGQSTFRGVLLSVVASVAMVSVACSAYKSQGLWILTLIWFVNLLFRLSFISSPQLRCVSKIAAIIMFGYPLAFKLFYEHHLIFPVMGGALFLLVLASMERWSPAIVAAFLFGSLALVMLDQPWLMFSEWKILNLVDRPSGAAILASTRFSLVGLLVSGLAFHTWTRSKAFHSLTRPTGGLAEAL